EPEKKGSFEMVKDERWTEGQGLRGLQINQPSSLNPPSTTPTTFTPILILRGKKSLLVQDSSFI
ncbi:hypothetical protein J6590_056936, partial [Homalodisca vitripennis]